MEDNQAPQWIRVRAKLRAEYGEAAYRSWLKPVSLISAGRGVVQISAPTKFMRDWVDQQYGDRLLELWSDEDPNIRVIDIVHSGAVAAATPARPATASSVWSSKYSDKNNLDQNKSDRNNNVGARLDSRFDFSNFVVGKPNELAFAAARRVAEADVAPFNPLFLYGGVGLGKTHLMHAIAWELQANRPDINVMYLSAEQFMYRFVQAAQRNDGFQGTISFRRCSDDR